MRNLIFLFFVLVFSFSFKALGDDKLIFPETLKEDDFISIKLHTEYFFTADNYISFAGYNSLAPNKRNYFYYLGLFPSVSYALWPEHIQAELFLNSFFASSVIQDKPQNLFRTTAVGLGVKAFKNWKNLKTGVEILMGSPFSKLCSNPNELLQNQMIVGEGVCFIEPGVWVFSELSRSFSIYAGSSFKYQGVKVPGRVKYRIGTIFDSRYMSIGAGLDGFISVSSNSQVLTENERKQREMRLNGLNAGSWRFYSPFPSRYLSFLLWLDLKYEWVNSRFYFAKDTLGLNYSRGYNIGVIGSLNIKKSKKKIKRKKRSLLLNFDKKRKNRKTDSYFREEEEPQKKKKKKGISQRDLSSELKEEIHYLKKN